ncbi:MAG: aminotransferase class I/II-fold pyridoxal phosphate-dependent enzyme [Verrucomicrobia bacterium]|nr:aminotransferase class I/II-fold pyridoxal phosphate-dependent enzyme [Cytophagales bacterium]
MIDLRSDTFTKPSQEMLEAMFSAEVGDDVWDEDPTVKALQNQTSRLFGMEAGLFCPSGTMTNQIAIKLFTQPGQEVICDKLAHIYNYEGGGIAFNSGASVRLLNGDRGRFTATQVTENINANDIHYPPTALVALENTVNKGGGCFYQLTDIEAIHDVCQAHHLPIHLDGARIFNALTASGEKPEDYGRIFTSISVCFSKGLGCPIGSVLLSSEKNIRQAKRIRKVLGGGWRQAGFLAAAGLFALENNITRLKDDHHRAKMLSETLQELPFVKEIFPVDTNIVIFRLENEQIMQDLISFLSEDQIKVASFGKNLIRMVTHLDFTDAMLHQTCQLLRQFEPVFSK